MGRKIKFIPKSLISFFLLAVTLFSTGGVIYSNSNFSFNAIKILGQDDKSTLYENPLSINLEDLTIEYQGDLEDLSIIIEGGQGYEIVDETTVLPTINYNSTWPSAGETITINLLITDGSDQVEFGFKVLVIPPILQLSYNENGCEGTISFTASAYKPSGDYTESFPFTFRLIDSNGDLFEEQVVDFFDARDNSARATFGGLLNQIDRAETYVIEVEDNLGRTFQRSAGPVGQTYSLDFQLNFSGLLCAEDNSGVVEFVVFNAALPLTSFVVFDENNNEVFNSFDPIVNVVAQGSGFIVVQVEGLNPGTYTLAIADNNTCTGSREFEIVIPPDILVDTELTPISCPGTSDAQIQIDINGGWSEPFVGGPRDNWLLSQIEWYDQQGNFVGNGQTSYQRDGDNQIIGVRNIIPNLGPGTYQATIWDRGNVQQIAGVDDLGCRYTTQPIEIESVEPLMLNSEVSNVSCFDQGDGSIIIDPSGGTPTYSIQWFEGNFEEESSPDPDELSLLLDDETSQNNLGPGLYAILLTDANGCQIAENFEILEPSELEIALGEDRDLDISCFGESTARIPYSILSGEGPFSVTILLNGENLETVTVETTGEYEFKELGAGTYEIEVEEANGCLKTLENIQVTQPESALEITEITISEFNGFQISCFEADDAFISVEAQGGNGQLSYSWEGPGGFESSEPEIQMLSPGTYKVTVTGENGCSLESEDIIINEPEPISLNEVVSDFNGFGISCFGAQDGSIMLELEGGATPYTISWQGPDGEIQANEELTNLGPGVYDVVVEDANGCSIEVSFTLEEPEALEIAELEDQRNDVICFGETTGTIGLELVQASTAPFMITWGLTGSEDALGEETGWVGESYLIENLSGGDYWVAITDANGCEQRLENIPIAEPDSGLDIENLIISQFGDYEISCHGASDASISFDIIGAQGETSIEWAGPDGFASDNNSLSDLGPGTYELTIIDEDGCTFYQEFEITEPELLTINSEVSDYAGFQIRCFGGDEGFIEIVAEGGAGDYSFSWEGDNGFTSNEPSIEGLIAGTYTLIVEDGNGCSVSETFILEEPGGLEIAELEEERADVLCFGESTGSLTVTITNTSAGPYSYYLQLENEERGSIETEENSNETTKTFENLPAGTYSIIVEDANECSQIIETITITEPESGLQFEEISLSDYEGFELSCHDSNDGSISIIVSGGDGQYAYSWTGPEGFQSDSPEISGLAAGVYELEISDGGDCILSSGPISLQAPEPLTLSPSVSSFNGFEISCFGANDAEITLAPTGGTGTFTFLWTGPDGFTSREESLQNLSPGLYEVEMTDNNGCVERMEFTLVEPDPLTAEVVETFDILCHGEATGAISLSVGGGLGSNYQFEWKRNGQVLDLQEHNPTQLLAGNYEVTIRDLNGCDISLEEIVLNEPAAALRVSLEQSEISCYNANDAYIRAEIEGGVEPYNLIWNNGSIQPEITGLGPGEYILTVEDANGCLQTASAVIPELPLFEINPEVKQVSCYGENDGSIALNLGGGEAPVRVFWDHGPEQSSIFNLPPGSYGVRIVDGKGCEIRREFEITEPDLLILTGQARDALDCDDGQSGSIDLVVSGGRPPFRFNWSNGDTLQNLSNLSSGTYSVEVTDQGGCFASQTFQIRRPAPLEVFMANTQEASCDLQIVEEKVELNIQGGVAPYSIQWSSGEISENGYKMSTTSPGIYSVEITDGQGCTVSTSLEVDNHRIVLDPSIRSQAYLDYQAHLVNMEVEFINNSSGNILTYYWDFGDGSSSLEESPTHTYQEEGEYEVSLRAVDMFGCEYEQNLTLQILDHFVIVPNVFTPNRDGMNDFMFPKFLLVRDLSFTVLNKWGEVIFQSDDLQSKGWDGTFKGEVVQPGNYVYHLNYTTEDGRNFKKNGVFLLMR